MKIALRMDDITADMNWDNFFRLKELFDKAGVRPPCVHHEKGRVISAESVFRVRRAAL